MLRPIFYDFLKSLTRITQKVYFKRWQVHFTHPLPENASIIFAANHQNSFLDAIALICSQPWRPTWLTRASMFKTSIARFWLHAFYMLPIYRRRMDGMRSVSKNQDIIEECIRLLNEEKQPIGIFPEGNHNMKMSLRPLQKGIARIAFDAAAQSGDPSNLLIVPCGFTYSDHTRFRSNLLINYGKHIYVKEYLDSYEKDPAKTVQKLVEEVKNELREVMIHINPENYVETFRLYKKHKKYHRDLYKEFLADRELIRKIQSGEFNEPETHKSSNLFFKIIGFPFYLFGLINNLPLLGILRLMEKKLISDPHFISPIRAFGSMALVPVLYLIQGSLFYFFTGLDWWWTPIYLITIFFLGMFAGDYHNQFISSKPYER